jgi:neutral amino acid transport system substrate-binding protein
LGQNLEQAITLAIEDVNRAGGISGIPLELLSRDSNSGSERGLVDLLDLLYGENVSYLIGPEENKLANEIASDVRNLDILNILPGDAAPSTKRASSTGAWLRLAPTPSDVACGLGAHSIAERTKLVNVVYSLEDYNTNLVTDFRFHFRNMGGSVQSSTSVRPNEDSYQTAINAINSSKATESLLIAYPVTAAKIITEWDLSGHRGRWYLSPLLYTEVFLQNVPYGSLEGAFGLSPTLSLDSECELRDGYTSGLIHCSHGNADRFVQHYVDRWDGVHPSSTAHFYYDGIVLLAMALQYAVATQGSIPSSKEVHRLIRFLNQTQNEPASWDSIKSAMIMLTAGKAVRYVGAAASYQFDEFGVAKHRTFDSWTVHDGAFKETGVYYAGCFVR